MYVALRGAQSNLAAVLIDKVMYELHPTFRPDTVTALPPTFGIHRYGWGTFTVGCIIHWKPCLHLPPTQVNHYLIFEREGGRSTTTVEIGDEAIAPLDNLIKTHTNGNSHGRPAAIPRGIRRRGTDGATAPSPHATPASAARAAVPSMRSRPSPRADPASARAPRMQPSSAAGAAAPVSNPAAAAGAMPATEAMSVLEAVVGNRWAREPGTERYRWTMYVSLPQVRVRPGSIIDRVVYELPGANPPSTAVARSPSFELTRVGEDISQVICTIHWCARSRVPPTVVEHQLILEGDGGRTAVAVGVPSRFLPALARQAA